MACENASCPCRSTTAPVWRTFFQQWESIFTPDEEKHVIFRAEKETGVMYWHPSLDND